MFVRCGVLGICSNMCSCEFATIKITFLICTPIFRAALFTVANGWKKPKCPRDEWINKMRRIYIMEYYSALKKEGNSGTSYDID